MLDEFFHLGSFVTMSDPNPLNWLDGSLERLDARHLLTDDQKIRLLTALHGNLRIEPLPRSREGDLRYLNLDGECSWAWRQEFLGLTMMNGPISVSVDGQPLPQNKNYPGSWTWSYPRINATWPLPALTVGRHIVKVENVSALVAKEDLTGLSSTAPPSDWPPAKKRWTRAVELELNVYSPDAVLVQQTREPALDPLRKGSLSANPVIIRSKGNRAQATLSFNVPLKDSVPVSFDVALRIGGQTISYGSLWAVQTAHGETCSGVEQSADLAPPAATVTEADIILTPNPKPIEHIASVECIWGGQIILSNVPLRRLDLKTDAPNLSFGPVTKLGLTFDTNGLTDWLNLEPGNQMRVRKFETSQDVPDGVYFGHSNGHVRGEDGTMVPAQFLTVNDAGGTFHQEVENESWDTNLPANVWEQFSYYGKSNVMVSDGIPLKALPATRIFKTQSGSLGILQITGFTENPRGVELRYKLVQNAVASPAPTATAPAAPKLSFGQMAMRTIQASETETNLFLNLDTGQLLTPPEDIRALFKESYATRISWEWHDDPRALKMREWLRSSGANLMVGDGRRGSEQLEIREAAAFPPNVISNGVVVPFGFDQADANYLATRLQRMLDGLLKQNQSNKTIWTLQPGFDPRLNERQDSFCFKTSKGAVGILQIVDAEGNPAGVRVRYKLVQQ
jgi:hypothetical protein